VPRKGGGFGPFPHFLDRAKPGVIVVTPDGRRFMNEAHSYHDFGQGLAAATPPGKDAVCFVIAGHSTVRKYGLGHAKPFPVPLDSSLKTGYLLRADTLPELAKAAGIDPVQLVKTVERYNEHAPQGKDPDFGRGSSAYNRYFGDPLKTPNPNVGPIEEGPYYAVRIVAGDLGSFAGIKTDGVGRVVDNEDRAIEGLYAVGNDAASIMSGAYPGPGITLGPAITFGYLAARDIAKARVKSRAGRPVEQRREPQGATV
jgi:succinate dehydrogenase/fumarate reductase flavoprotein subunit